MRWKGDVVGLVEMRAHYANYFKGIPNFKDYRIKLVTTNELDAVHNLLNEIADKFATAEVE